MRISDWSSDVCSSDLDAFNGIFRYIYWSSSRRRRDLHSRRLSGSIDSRSPPPAPPGLGGWRSLIGERQARPENARLTKLLRGNSESIIQCSCRGSVDLVEEIACENAGGNALVAERVAPMDARVDDSKSLLRYGIGDGSEEHTSALQSIM